MSRAKNNLASWTTQGGTRTVLCVDLRDYTNRCVVDDRLASSPCKRPQWIVIDVFLGSKRLERVNERLWRLLHGFCCLRSLVLAGCGQTRSR